jgi:uncharacterized protein YfdQ (DUF2303 family)
MGNRNIEDALGVSRHSVHSEGAADAAAITFAAGAALNGATKHPHDKDKSYFILPEGYEYHPISKSQTPELQQGNVALTAAESFIYYVNQHKRPDSLIYANGENSAKFIAVFDEHNKFDNSTYEESFLEGCQNGIFAQHRDFRATLTLEWSQEWKTWKNNNRKPATQLDFANFIEENLDDLIEPTGSEMLTTVLEFQSAKDGRFNSKANLQNGSVEFVYVDNVTQESGKLTMPTMITINIPVIKHSTPQPISARLKYRVKDSTLLIWYEIIRAYRIEDDAIQTIADKIAETTSLPVLHGDPL